MNEFLRIKPRPERMFFCLNPHCKVTFFDGTDYIPCPCCGGRGLMAAKLSFELWDGAAGDAAPGTPTESS